MNNKNNNGFLIGVLVFVAVVVVIGLGYSVFSPKSTTAQEDTQAGTVAASDTSDTVPAVDSGSSLADTDGNTADSMLTPVAVPSASAVIPNGEAPNVSTLGASSVSATDAVLNGTLATSGSESYYSFQFGPTTDFGYATRTAPIDGSNVPLSVSLVGFNLQPSTTYYYRLIAQNVFGDAVGSIMNFTTLGSSGAVLSPAIGNGPQVVTLGASSISATNAVLNGTLVTADSDSYYSFQFGPTNNLGYTTRTAPVDGSTGDSQVALVAFNLQPLTVYYYRLIAQSQYGNAIGSVMSFMTPAQ